MKEGCKGIVGRRKEGRRDIGRVHLLCASRGHASAHYIPSPIQCVLSVMLPPRAQHHRLGWQQNLSYGQLILEFLGGQGQKSQPANPTVCRASAQKLSSAVELNISQGVLHSGISGPVPEEAPES
jgi:hypothetical protein